MERWRRAAGVQSWRIEGWSSRALEEARCRRSEGRHGGLEARCRRSDMEVWRSRGMEMRCSRRDV